PSRWRTGKIDNAPGFAPFEDDALAIAPDRHVALERPRIPACGDRVAAARQAREEVRALRLPLENDLAVLVGDAHRHVAQILVGAAVALQEHELERILLRRALQRIRF